MRKKFLLLVLASFFLPTVNPAHAQQTGKVLRIGFLDNSTASGSAVLADAFRQELSKLGWIEGKNFVIEYRFTEQKIERLPELAAGLVRLKVDLIVVGGVQPALAAKKATSTIPIVRIVELAVKYRLPAIYHQKEFVDDGGLMSYGADFDDLYRRAAVYVDKILKGAKPAELPVQQATKFEFVINLKAAKQIGLTLSPEFLARANQVIR